MNTKRLQLICEFLTEQMNHWLLFPLALAMAGFAERLQGRGEPCLLYWVMCGLFPPAFFAFRCRCKRLIPLVILHLAVLVPVFLIPDRLYIGKTICLASALGYMLYSLTLRLKHNSVYSNAMHMAVGVGMSAASFLFQYYQGMKEWENYYLVALIAGISLYFVITYMEGYLDFLSKNQSSAGFLPAAEMFHSGMGLVLGYTLLGAVLLAFSAQIGWFSSILQLIKRVLLQLLRFLFSLLAGEPEAEQPLAEKDPMEEMGDLLPPGAGETFWLWKVLEIIVTILFWAGVLFVTVKLLIVFAKLIRRHLSLHFFGRKALENEEEIVDVREKCASEESAGKKRKNIFDSLSHRERIRKLYKKKLLSESSRMGEQDRGRLGMYTAKEWERRLDANGMAKVYEHARYSGGEVSVADVKRMKDACKGK